MKDRLLLAAVVFLAVVFVLPAFAELVRLLYFVLWP